MRGAVVPTKNGYALVILHDTAREGGVSVRVPTSIPPDLQVQTTEKIKADVAEYLWKLSRWEGTGVVALVWAAFSALCLATSTIWDYGWRMIALYGWVRVWFMGDGFQVLSQFLFKWRDLVTARSLRKTCTDLEIAWTVDEALPVLADMPDGDEDDVLHVLAAQFPALEPYYRQMLEHRPPVLHEEVPLTILGRMRNMIMGVPTRLPAFIYYIGGLV